MKQPLANLLFVLAALLPPMAAGHDSPEHVIEMLTARIESVGESAHLLWRRATEYRALGNLSAAARDLNRAIRLQPDGLQALTDLSRVQLAQGRRRQALATIDRAFKLVNDEPDRAPLRMLRAEIFCETGESKKALAECDLALRYATGAELDWYLTRSQIQCRLGRFNEAVAGLQQGFELTGSAVLEVESIDAMIDAGRFGEALEKIEPALAETRWRSSWLLRRARVRLGSGEISGAHADLLEAIRELNQRLQAPLPDATLLADRGLAYALSDDLALAKRDLTAAKKLGADAGTLRRLEVAVAARR